MLISTTSLKEKRKGADLLVLPYWQTEKGPEPAFNKSGLNVEVLSLLEADFKGEVAEVLSSYVANGIEKKILLVGLGRKEECESSLFRKAFASVVDFCRKKKIGQINCFLPIGDKQWIRPIIEGLCLSNYAFDQLKRENLQNNPTFLLKGVCFIGGQPSFITAEAEYVQKVAESVKVTRDLVNGNADDVKADSLVDVAKKLAKTFHKNVECKVLRQKELEKEKMGLLLAVNKAAEEQPALILLQYKGDPNSKDLTAIVGKGVTFDTGGLNLKPTGGMETMKSDMAGAAAILGTIHALASLGIKKNVIGVLAVVENAISSKSFKPGDVFISHSGKSVEITNTDAEGRLILADAFSYVQDHYKPNRMIDLATLTGGIVIALGEDASGLFCNDDELAKQLKKASIQTGDKVWQMPLLPEYKKILHSSIADIKNGGVSRKASPCVAATFLHQFVQKGLPWAHIDIAGTAYLTETTALNPSPATGVGVRLLLSFLEEHQV